MPRGGRFGTARANLCLQSSQLTRFRSSRLRRDLRAFMQRDPDLLPGKLRPEAPPKPYLGAEVANTYIDNVRGFIGMLRCCAAPWSASGRGWPCVLTSQGLVVGWGARVMAPASRRNVAALAPRVVTNSVARFSVARTLSSA